VNCLQIVLSLIPVMFEEGGYLVMKPSQNNTHLDLVPFICPHD